MTFLFSVKPLPQTVLPPCTREMMSSTAEFLFLLSVKRKAELTFLSQTKGLMVKFYWWDYSSVHPLALELDPFFYGIWWPAVDRNCASSEWSRPGEAKPTQPNVDVLDWEGQWIKGSTQCLLVLGFSPHRLSNSPSSSLPHSLCFVLLFLPTKHWEAMADVTVTLSEDTERQAARRAGQEGKGVDDKAFARSRREAERSSEMELFGLISKA